MKAGDTLRYHRVPLSDALARRANVEDFINRIGQCCSGNASFDSIKPLKYDELPASVKNRSFGKAVVHHIPAEGPQPQVSYRQGGDDYLLIDYGEGAFDLNHRCRVTALIKALRESRSPITFSTGLVNTVGCGNSLMLYYDGSRIPQSDLIKHLTAIESELGNLRSAKVPSRLFKLPLTFESKRQDAAIQRYIETQRPYASYLPDNADFVAKNNGFTKKELQNIYLTANFMAVAVGFFTALPLCLPVDPRQRMNCPKMNPSRVFTPEGQLSWGGSCMALYNVESPGGYQLTGLTIPGVDILGFKKGYSTQKPWLFEDFDQLTFYEVSEDEYERERAVFHSGLYEYQVEDAEFDMAEHNRLLEETKSEVVEIRKRQRTAQEQMNELEKEMLERWEKEKKEGQISMDSVEALLDGKSSYSLRRVFYCWLHLIPTHCFPILAVLYFTIGIH